MTPRPPDRSGVIFPRSRPPEPLSGDSARRSSSVEICACRVARLVVVSSLSQVFNIVGVNRRKAPKDRKRRLPARVSDSFAGSWSRIALVSAPMAPAQSGVIVVRRSVVAKPKGPLRFLTRQMQIPIMVALSEVLVCGHVASDTPESTKAHEGIYLGPAPTTPVHPGSSCLCLGFKASMGRETLSRPLRLFRVGLGSVGHRNIGGDR